VLNERTGAKSSKGAAANRPSLFESITQPKNRFIAVPSVSSEKRKFIPVAILEPSVILNNAVFFIATEDSYIFTVLQSTLFRVWVANFSSRLKSDYQISASSVYNTFPFPDCSLDEKAQLKELSDKLLELRAKRKDVSLGDLYDPLLMPLEITNIHKKIDAVLLKNVGLSTSSTETEMLKVLLDRYLISSK
jgi:hypothetical protein